MIVRESAHAFIMTTQHEHARLSAQSAEQLPERLFGNHFMDDVLLAIREHDRSWIRLDDISIPIKWMPKSLMTCYIVPEVPGGLYALFDYGRTLKLLLIKIQLMGNDDWIRRMQVNYNFLPMTKKYAALICKWHYEEPYSLYSLEESEECISEFMNGDYYAGLMGNELIGFICSGQSARVGGGYRLGIYDDNAYLDIGLGMRPDITGRGKGLIFLKEAMSFMKQLHANCTLQLVVASFNGRAMTVYERAGFHKRMQFSSMIDDQEIQFTLMQQSQHDYFPEH